MLSPGATRASVGCELVFDVATPVTLLVRVSVARTGLAAEALGVTLDGEELPVSSEPDAPGEVMATVEVGRAGHLVVTYRADVVHADVEPPGSDDHARRVALRPSRYCPSDTLAGFARTEFGSLPPGRPQVEAVVGWIHDRLVYGGNSRATDDALVPLQAGEGVCRDFAHLAITLCRALEIPARYVAVYAPGLSPMDFHAVFEAWVDDGWHVFDATRLAPRTSLVRIATGRDAADTAFTSVLGGVATLIGTEISAVATPQLPADDHHALVRLP